MLKDSNWLYRIWPNYHTVRLGFSQLLGKLVVKYVSIYTKGTLKKDQWRTYLMILLQCFLCFFILIFLINHMLRVLYKEVDKNYSGCNRSATELLDCALMGAWAVIRSNMVFLHVKSFAPKLCLRQWFCYLQVQLHILLISISDLQSVYMIQCIAFPTRLHVRPAETQISLCISSCWSDSWPSTWRCFGSFANHSTS